MFCSNCGAKVPDDAKFCASCGKPIGGAVAVDTVPATPVEEEEIELARAKIGIRVNPGTLDCISTGTGFLTDKRFIVKQAGLFGLTNSIVNLLVEGKTVIDLPYVDIQEAYVKKKMLGNILIITSKNGDKIEVTKQGMSSKFLDEWSEIINEHIQ